MIRSLREWDTEVRVVGTEVDRYYRHLSQADVTYRVPAASDDNYLSELSAVIKEEAVDVVLPSNGWEVRAVSESQSQLPAATALPTGTAIDTFQNKWSSYRALRDAGVPVPETTLIRTESDIPKAFETISSDHVWVRGIGIKDIPGRSMRDPKTVVNWIEYNDAWGNSTVATRLPGRDLTWLGVFDQGELVCSQGRERLDYSTSESWGTGAPTVSRTIHDAEVNRIGREAIEAIDGSPHGVYFTDMREDDDGQPRVTEVNPGRLGTTSAAFYLDAGLNLTGLLVRIASADDYESPPTTDALPADQYFISKPMCEPVIVDGEEVDTDDE
jgi:carbamoyl-phosphate synthase large subunit